MSQNASPNKKPTNSKELWQIIAKPVTFLLILIMVCAFLAHYLTGSETLEEYAANNPELAYGDGTETENTDDTTESENTDSTTAITAETENPDNNSESENSDNSDDLDTSDRTLPDTDTVDESSAYNSTEYSSSEIEDMTANSERTTYQDGFYYEPLSESIKERITGISYPETGCTVPYEDLRYVGLLYVDFDGETQTGELICNKAIAQDMVEIFYELYRNDYRIERVRLVDEYDGDDTLSMLDNNTSCFNYRVVDGTTTLSKHALGCAIDINPFYNPYIVYNKNGSGETYISPKGSEIYADRSQNFPYKIDENDLCYKLFTARGFTWGGNWKSTKDYQHFQITLP